MKIIKKIIIVAIGLVGVAGAGLAAAQITGSGLAPAANTTRAFQDASIMRDSGLNQPLDLLNDFYPAIAVNISDHDNVRRRSDIEEDDLLITVSPSLGYRTNIGRHQFYAAYSGRFTYHDKLDQEDARSNALTAQLGLDLSRSWDVTLFAGVGDSYEERGISGARPFNQLVPNIDSGPDEVDYDFYGADIIYGRKFSPFVASFGIERHSSSYKNNFQGFDNATGGRDRESDSIHLDLSYKIGAVTSVFGRIQRTDVDYDRSFNSLDSEQTTYTVGVRMKPTNALSGVVGVGTSEKDFVDPSIQDYDSSFTYYANLNYAFNPFSNLELTASRAIEEPGDEQSNYYETDYLGVGLYHSFTPQLTFNAFAKWADDNYDTDRDDEFFDFGLGLDYAWRPWLTAGIYYGEIERESNLENADFEDRYFGLRLRSDLRPLMKGRRSSEEPNRSFKYPRPTNR